MAKKIQFDIEAREGQKKGVDALANAVKVTLGPKGRNVIIGKSFGGDTQQIGGVKKTTDFLDKTTWILASLILVLILFSNITLNSESDNFESELIQNQEQLDIEEILENTNDDPNPNE